MQKKFETRTPWASFTYNVVDGDIESFTMFYGPKLQWTKKHGYKLTTDEYETGVVKGSLLTLGGGEAPLGDHVKALLELTEVPESERTFLAAKVSEFREHILKKSAASEESQRLKFPAAFPEYFDEMKADHHRICLEEVFKFLASYPATSDLLKTKIAFALELQKHIDDDKYNNIEIAVKLRDQLGSVSVLAGTISSIARFHWLNRLR